MPSPTFNIPTLGDPNATEDIDIRDALLEIKTLLDAGLDSANLDAAAAILHSQLDEGTPGEILIANSSGTITGTTVTGDITIDEDGVSAIGDNKVTRAKILDDAVGPDELDEDAVDTAHIQDAAVTSDKLDISFLHDYEMGNALTTGYVTQAVIALTADVWEITASYYGYNLALNTNTMHAALSVAGIITYERINVPAVGSSWSTTWNIILDATAGGYNFGILAKSTLTGGAPEGSSMITAHRLR